MGGRRRRACRQTRKSGEPYITHPVAVAQVLAGAGLDVETLVAAILHDTIEDTLLSRRGDIAQQFGETVAELVDGVSSWTSCISPTGRPPRKASARCCWRCRDDG